MDARDREVQEPSRGEFAELESVLTGIASKQQAVEYECNQCEDSGYIYDFESHRVIGECKCMVRKNTVAFEQWKIDQVAELQKRIGIKVDLSNTRPHILMGKDLPRAIWLHGKSGGGKTHMMAWAIREKIKKAPLKTKWVWVTIRPLIAAWSGQYSPETDVRIEAMSLIRTVRDAAIVGLDDVDKIGTITPAREEAFFDMFDDIYNKGVCLMVSSQFSIQEFCMRMPNEKMFTERDGIGPQTRRLLDICEQIKV